MTYLATLLQKAISYNESLRNGSGGQPEAKNGLSWTYSKGRWDAESRYAMPNGKYFWTVSVTEGGLFDVSESELIAGQKLGFTDLASAKRFCEVAEQSLTSFVE